ncbi:hypothetical protein LJC15_01235 [Desulfovibrio sp. OttesenSCG-928-G11]|nr:hypothetical protein [Desulfovibrio sp. OttesenSCG-928-G11]
MKIMQIMMTLKGINDTLRGGRYAPAEHFRCEMLCADEMLQTLLSLKQ